MHEKRKNCSFGTSEWLKGHPDYDLVEGWYRETVKLESETPSSEDVGLPE